MEMVPPSHQSWSPRAGRYTWSRPGEECRSFRARRALPAPSSRTVRRDGHACFIRRLHQLECPSHRAWELPDATQRALEAAAAQVIRLSHPSDADIRKALSEQVDSVVVFSRDDAVALRLALVVEHIRPGVPLIVTVHSRIVAAQLRRAVGNIRVTSMADIVAPTLAAPCLDDGLLSVRHTSEGFSGVRAEPVALVAQRIDDATDPAQRHAIHGFLRDPGRHRTFVGVEAPVNQQIQLRVEQLSIQLIERQTPPTTFTEDTQHRSGAVSGVFPADGLLHLLEIRV